MTTATLKKRYNMADDQEVVRLITDNMDKLEEHVTYSSKKWEVDDEGVQILDKIVGYHENISASIQQKMDLKEENRKLQELCNERAAQIQEAKKVTAQIQAQLAEREKEFDKRIKELTNKAIDMQKQDINGNLLRTYQINYEKAKLDMERMSKNHEEIERRDRERIEELTARMQSVQEQIDRYADIDKQLLEAKHRENRALKEQGTLLKELQNNDGEMENLKGKIHTIQDAHTDAVHKIDYICKDVSTALSIFNDAYALLHRTIETNAVHPDPSTRSSTTDERPAKEVAARPQVKEATAPQKVEVPQKPAVVHHPLLKDKAKATPVDRNLKDYQNQIYDEIREQQQQKQGSMLHTLLHKVGIL